MNISQSGIVQTATVWLRNQSD